MNKYWKRKWIAALESGKYRQTTEYLCQSENKKRTYCCLGVLCEVAGVPREKDYSYDGRYDVLSSKLLARFDLSHRDQDILTDMNDEQGASFKEIAIHIKENL